jgi:antitoxin FitA
MPTTMTLKNIPDQIYDRLKLSAEMHRRSMNNEAIICLETVLIPMQVTPNERLARIRAARVVLPSGALDHADVDTFKRQGRA